jgi:hypothetical protein
MALEAPEAADAVEAIQDAAEGRAHNESFRRRAAIAIGVLAMLLAISGLGGANATKEMLNANIQASDTYAFYQAKNIRQTSNQLAANEFEVLLLTQPDLTDGPARRSPRALTSTKPPWRATKATRAPAKGRWSCSQKRTPTISGGIMRRTRTPALTSPRRCFKSRSSWGRSASSPRRGLCCYSGLGWVVWRRC